jgi:hypothetical protein
MVSSNNIEAVARLQFAVSFFYTIENWQGENLRNLKLINRIAEKI